MLVYFLISVKGELENYESLYNPIQNSEPTL